MDSSILTTLNNIHEQTRELSQVGFAFHTWMPLNNLCADGYRVKCIQSPEIPPMTLIPIVSLRQNHINSRLDPRTNKYVPQLLPYQIPLEQSFSTLVHRYAAVGMLRVLPLDCSLEEAPRYVHIFEQIANQAPSKLQYLPEFFGARSPVAAQLGPSSFKLKKTAADIVNELFELGQITDRERDLFLQSIPFFARAASAASMHAIDPVRGILTSSITQINDPARRKSSFDNVDNFCISQFPDFDASTRIHTKTQDRSLEKLAELLEAGLSAKLGADSLVTTQSVQVEQPFADSAKGEISTVSEKVQCSVIKNNGEQCRGTAVVGDTMCAFHVKQINAENSKVDDSSSESTAAAAV